MDRAKLLDILLRAAGQEHPIQTRKECIGFEQHAGGVKAWFKDGSSEEGDLLIQQDMLLAVSSMSRSLEDVHEGAASIAQAEQAFKEMAASTGDVSLRVQRDDCCELRSLSRLFYHALF